MSNTPRPSPTAIVLVTVQPEPTSTAEPLVIARSRTLVSDNASLVRRGAQGVAALEPRDSHEGVIHTRARGGTCCRGKVAIGVIAAVLRLLIALVAMVGRPSTDSN
jgi:hypothetical protein